MPVPPDGLAPPDALAPPDPEPEPEPPAPPAPPAPPVPPVPPAEEPPDEAAAPPDEAAVPPLEDEEDEGADPLLELAAVVGVVAVVEVGVVDGVTALADAAVGTVNGGAPEPSIDVEPPLPQAETPADRTMAAARAASGRVRQIIYVASGTEWVHPPAAVWAVVQVLLGELVAPIAKTNVLNCPGKL